MIQNMRFLTVIALLGLLAFNSNDTARGQSPNLTGAVTRLELSSYQSESEKNIANGYVGLDGSMLIPPQFIFPNFSSAVDGTIWVKSGLTLIPQPGLLSGLDGITAVDIHIGNLAGGQTGIEQTLPLGKLVLRSGSSNNIIYISNGQTLGGANPSYSGTQWSIGPTGTFVLGGGQFNGAVSMNNQDITLAKIISGPSTSINFATGAVAGPLSMTGTITVPNADTAGIVNRPVNRFTGDTLYGTKSAANTWAGINTFALQPVFQTPLSIAQIFGLQGALDGKLSLAGGTMTGAGGIAMTNAKITGLGNPSADQDAATKIYVDGRTTTSTGGTLDSMAVGPGGTALSKASVAGVTTISLPAASTSTSGYLSSANWNTFNGKVDPFSVTPPLNFAGNILSIPAATTSQSGYITAGDWNSFAAKEPALTFMAPIVRGAGLLSQEISMPMATDLVSGYMSAADHQTLTDKAPKASPALTGIVTINGSLQISGTALAEGSGGTGETTHIAGQVLIGNATGGLTPALITGNSGITVQSSSGSIQVSLTEGVSERDANTFLAGPASGGDGLSTWRAIVTADINNAIPIIPRTKGGFGIDLTPAPFSTIGAMMFRTNTSWDAVVSGEQGRAALAATNYTQFRAAANIFIGTVIVDFGVIPVGSFDDKNPADVPGSIEELANTGDIVQVAVVASLPQLVLTAHAPSIDQIIVRAQNVSTTPTIDLPPTTVTVMIHTVQP